MAHINPSPSQRVTAGGVGLPAAIVVIIATSVFVGAGFWQLHRARYKDELKAKVEIALRGSRMELRTSVRAENVEFHAVHVNGEWAPEKTIFIDNKIKDGVVGYYVVTPLHIAGSHFYVLVNRGWIAAPRVRSELPRITTPNGMVEVSGIARAPSNRFLELSDQSNEGDQGRIWQNLTIERFRSWSGLTLLPTVVFQQDSGDDNLERVPVAPEAAGLSADRHRGYALTWFGLAVVTLGLAIAAIFNSSKNGKED